MTEPHWLTPLEFLSILGDGLWHTTSPQRFKGILRTKAILPNPTIPDVERWCTRGGPKHYPFARSLGGVSLFDFAGFDSTSYHKNYPMSSWEHFVPYRSEWESAMWIEIDRNKAADAIISGPDLLKKWDSENAHGHMLMPLIEAVHIGPIPQQVFARVLSVDGDGWKTLES